MDNRFIVTIAISVALVLLSIPTFAYFEDYPPFNLEKQISFSSLKPIVDLDEPNYRVGDVAVSRKETKKGVELIIKDGEKTILKKTNLLGYRNDTAIPYEVYYFDIDKNGLMDFVVFSNWDGAGLASFNDHVDIFLKKEKGSYQHISYDTMKAGIEDFVDLDRDGKHEIIITGVYGGPAHNYFTYSLYRLKGYKLENADSKVNGFPKFVWMTNKPNDKNTTHLSKKECALDTVEKNKSVSYETI